MQWCQNEQREWNSYAIVIGLLLAIIIACLGLFGLAAYAAEQRNKEIGIRKVLGANVSTIAAMLSFDFIKLVFIAILIALPAGWFWMNKWLAGFLLTAKNIQWWALAARRFVCNIDSGYYHKFSIDKSRVIKPGR